MRRGVPISPERSLRTRTFPSEPVPPVTTTRLSVSIVPPNLRIRSRVFVHLFDHLRPTRGSSVQLSPEALRLQTAVAGESLVRLNQHLQPINLFDEREQVELINRLSRRVPHAVHEGALVNHFCYDACKLKRCKTAEDGATKTAHSFSFLAQEPFDETVSAL